MAGGTCGLTRLGYPEVLGSGVFTRLLFADEWIFVLGLGFEDEQREALGIEQEKIDEACRALLEVIAEGIQIGGLDLNAGFEANIGGCVADLEKSPAPRFEQLVDLDAGGCCLMGHSGSCSRDGGQAAFGVPDWVTKGLGLRITASNEDQSYFPLYRKPGK